MYDNPSAPAGVAAAPLSPCCEVRPEVRDFSPYVAGLSVNEIRERYGLESIIKMASNENPLGASPLVRQAVARHAGEVFRYAQSGNPRLAAAIGARHNLPADMVVTGNGSDEVIDLIIRARAVPGKHNIVAFSPCFSLYKLQSRLCGVEFRQAPLKEDFSFDWDGLARLVDADTALVFVTTPDNPSGYCPARAEAQAFADALPKSCLLVIDEAYMDFCDDEDARSLLPDFLQNGRAHGNVAILRTFSKSYGLAGLRLGYGVMPAPLADYLCRIRPPFSVNILAEEAGLAALRDDDFRAATLSAVREGRDYLTAQLRALGCRVYPSLANFLLLLLPAPHATEQGAARFFEELLKRGIIIRRLASYGLPAHLRVSVGNREENRIFIEAAAKILQGD